ncbi:NAD(P)-dependent dehydrogenase (short-subunit alcohol dehydrogenase family) [Pelomonas saccharophila]|uniref:NAD(P)-dependent dehydrogenase (Short-subunit alcohol dehydrogenase family) n=1 Tax=Roseateles saccharophilus TaxID=304 RepID=A0ABU1YFJ1_ROSSA|nr:SDR family NAD(P)-dependent oxidoreductase [Roseateles saccharophilus]MDR7267622.1 NAD(P)-dependent dehydrogenase (short-subunit alcohol dehydrogenase family) [Roseateles saccharophilus]
MHLYIVTGSSRGLGAALVQQLTQAGNTVIGIARKLNPELQAEQWSLDLTDPSNAAEHLQAWLRVNTGWQSATLINNAALLSEPGPLAASELSELSAALRVGLEAPTLLSRVFLAETSGVPQRRILNISSGLGRRAIAGSAAYCAIKAGLDHLSRALALEEPEVGIVSLAPGVIDTDMQVQLRGADPARFPEQTRFQGLKDGGQLQTAEATAASIVRYFMRPDFGKTVVADIRDT